jgi:magnesium transporter
VATFLTGLPGLNQPQNVTASEMMRLNTAVPATPRDDQHSFGVVAEDLAGFPNGRRPGDDVIDVVQEEATEDAYRSAAVDPLDETYLQTSVFTLTWKRGIWLAVLFFFALMTAFALQHYEKPFEQWAWLVPFIPLVISSGGNSGSQSATLIITALSRGHITLRDYRRVMIREIKMGMLLGSGLALMGFLVCFLFVPDDAGLGPYATLVVPLTLLLVVLCGTLTGSVLPLLFESLGWDPAMMSNPFVAGIVDILGILIYVTVAVRLLNPVVGG